MAESETCSGRCTRDDFYVNVLMNLVVKEQSILHSSILHSSILHSSTQY